MNSLIFISTLSLDSTNDAKVNFKTYPTNIIAVKTRIQFRNLYYSILIY